MNQYINKIVELFKVTQKSEASVKDFHEWLINDEQSQEKEKALFHLWNEPNEISREESINALSSFKSRFAPQFKLTRKNLFWRYAAAILILISVATVYTLTNKSVADVNFVENYSPVGKINTVELPDGSIVQINSSSILVYPDNFGNKTRTIYLSGEANFQVKKNEEVPFIVKSKNFSVTALGTEFNVSSYADNDFYKTTLIEGSIKIEDTENSIEQILKVEEQFIFDKNNSEYRIEKTNIEDVTAWQRGELVFRGATVEEIVKVLERKYGVMFHNNSKNADVYNFKFQKDASLSKVLEVMGNVVDNFSYKLTEDICYIY